VNKSPKTRPDVRKPKLRMIRREKDWLIMGMPYDAKVYALETVASLHRRDRLCDTTDHPSWDLLNATPFSTSPAGTKILQRVPKHPSSE